MKPLLIVEFNYVMKRFTYFDFFKDVDCDYRFGDLNYDNITDYCNSQQKTVAIVDCPYLVKPPTNLSMFDLVIVVDPETCFQQPADRVKELQQHFSNNNLITIAGGVSIDNPIDSPRFILLPWLMLEISLVNNTHSFKQAEKNKLFDALLGLNRPHRQFIFDSLANNDLLDRGYVSLLVNTTMNDDHAIYYRSPDLDLVEEDEIQQVLTKNSKIFKSFDHVRYQTRFPSNSVRASAVLPATIYDNSYFSIVAETNPTVGNFLTEKTAKPLYAGRLFVLFGSMGMLKQLHNYGFETFVDVINESYDTVLGNDQRLQMAFDQVRMLCNENLDLVYKKLEPKLKHNQTLLADHAHFCRPVAEKIKEFLV